MSRSEVRAEQLFVVMSISRIGIADSLNEAAGFTQDDDSGWWVPSEESYADAVPLEQDDERLTDEFCSQYAMALGDLESEHYGEDRYYDALVELDIEYAAKLGLIAPEDASEDEAPK